MKTLLYDCRYAWRGLRRAPGFAAVTIVTLALGIGANTAVFSVLKSVVLAPLPYDEPEQLVRLYHDRTTDPDQRQFLSGPDILDIREEVDAFESVGIHYTYREIGRDLTTDGQPTRLRVLRIGAGYFGTYRATPQLGRVFRREEERADTRRVVLSHQLWSTALGQNPDIVGTTVELDGEAYEVIGVMRPTFRDMTTADIAAWIPEDLERARDNNRGNYYLSAVARLATGVSVAQAQAEVDTVMAGLTQRFPESNADQLMQVVPLHGDVVGGSARAVSVLMGAAGLVLLIACVNVASLFLVRAVARGRNTAIRMALGAGRRRVVVQHLTESLVVAAAGGLLGSIVAHWGVQMLLRVSPESLARAETVGFDVPPPPLCRRTDHACRDRLRSRPRLARRPRRSG